MAPRQLTVISRDDAHAEGKRRYYTGQPCRKGHDCERYVINGACIDCTHRRPAPGPNPDRHRNVHAVPLVFNLEPMPTRAELLVLARYLEPLAAAELIRMRNPANWTIADLWPTEKCFAAGYDIHVMHGNGWTVQQLIEHDWAFVPADVAKYSP